jgi:hypothetical protein
MFWVNYCGSKQACHLFNARLCQLQKFYKYILFVFSYFKYELIYLIWPPRNSFIMKSSSTCYHFITKLVMLIDLLFFIIFGECLCDYLFLNSVLFWQTHSILRLGFIGVLGYCFQLFLGHNAAPYYRSKNRLVGHDVNVHKILDRACLP